MIQLSDEDSTAKKKMVINWWHLKKDNARNDDPDIYLVPSSRLWCRVTVLSVSVSHIKIAKVIDIRCIRLNSRTMKSSSYYGFRFYPVSDDTHCSWQPMATEYLDKLNKSWLHLDTVSSCDPRHRTLVSCCCRLLSWCGHGNDNNDCLVLYHPQIIFVFLKLGFLHTVLQLS